MVIVEKNQIETKEKIETTTVKTIEEDDKEVDLERVVPIIKNREVIKTGNMRDTLEKDLMEAIEEKDHLKEYSQVKDHI